MPRHREINDFLARKICKDLEVPMFAINEPRHVQIAQIVILSVNRY